MLTFSLYSNDDYNDDDDEGVVVAIAMMMITMMKIITKMLITPMWFPLTRNKNENSHFVFFRRTRSQGASLLRRFGLDRLAETESRVHSSFGRRR